MKIHRLLALTALIGSVTLAFAEPKFSPYTADYYKGAYEKYEGMEITLKVSCLTPASHKSDIPNVQFFTAHTRDTIKKVQGGEILIGVLSDDAEQLIHKYGTNPEEGQERILKGVLRADGNRLWFVDVNGDLTESLDARHQQLKTKN